MDGEDLPTDWLTLESYKKIYSVEALLHKTMLRAGWTSNLAPDPQTRVANFLDFLRETYVIPTYQDSNDSSRISRTSSMVDLR